MQNLRTELLTLANAPALQGIIRTTIVAMIEDVLLSSNHSLLALPPYVNEILQLTSPCSHVTSRYRSESSLRTY